MLLILVVSTFSSRKTNYIFFFKKNSVYLPYSFTYYSQYKTPLLAVLLRGNILNTCL